MVTQQEIQKLMKDAYISNRTHWPEYCNLVSRIDLLYGKDFEKMDSDFPLSPEIEQMYKPLREILIPRIIKD